MKLKRVKQMATFVVDQSNKALAKFLTKEWPQAIKERELWATSLLTLSAVDAVEILRHLTLINPGGVLLHTAAFGVAKTMAIGFVNRNKIAAVGRFAVEHQALTKFVAAHSLQMLRIWGNSDDNKEAFKNAFFYILKGLLKKDTYRILWSETKSIYSEVPKSMDPNLANDYTIEGCRVFVLPILNAAASPQLAMQKDIVWVICKTAEFFGKDLGYEKFKEQTADARGVIIIDPLIWAAYKHNAKWAQAIVDHEIGHMIDFETAYGKALLYGGLLIRDPKYKKLITLCQELRASWYAIEKDPDPAKIKTLVAAFLTYAMHD